MSLPAVFVTYAAAQSPSARCVEPFTAVSLCPRCSNVAVHQFRMPRRKPVPPEGDNPTAKFARRLMQFETNIVELSLGSGGGYDDPDAEVIRQCSCGCEWTQS